MLYITGDTHGGFQRFNTKNFPQQKQMGRSDYAVVTGDYAAKNIMPKPFILRRKFSK